jgi:glycosyltransferase involved in cell wall biosynthesis
LEARESCLSAGKGHVEVSGKSDRQVGASTLKPKLLMISSYRRSCGIAQYVEFLEVALRRHTAYDFDIAALPVDLFRSEGAYARKAANKIFGDIIARARQADVVSIQFELGLFGVSPFAIWRRLSAILQASRKVIITYHTAPIMGVGLKFNQAALRETFRAARINYVFQRLFAHARRHPEKFRHIVHTQREALNFRLFGLDPPTVVAEPLSFLAAERRDELAVPRSSRQVLDRRYGIEGRYIIGCFGFLADYKGIDVAVRALRHLPENYHLMVVGGLHPEAIVQNSTSQPYITRLVDQIENSKKIGRLRERVHFCGALSNEDFNLVMAGCDAVVLPYAEVGQTSSGPAALALDMQKPIYCSRTHCFKELDKFEPAALTFFEIGNHIELAQKLLREDANLPNRVAARRRYVELHNVERRARIYLDASDQLLSQ